MMRAALLLACLAQAAQSAAPASSRRVEVLLNAPMAKTAALGPLKRGLAVTPDRLILLGSRKEMFLVGWGGITPIKDLRGLDSFAYAKDGVLLGIRGRELVYLEKSGKLKTLFTLPSDGMGIVSGAGNRMFLFERISGKSGLYELLPGRKVVKILDSPEPIGAVAEGTGGGVFFAVGGSLFEAAPGKAMRTVATGGKPIQSLAVNGGRVYASDGACVFFLEGGRPTLITKQTGGDLQWLDGGLLVFDPKAPLLVRMTGL